MRYNVRGKYYPDGSSQFLHFSHLQDTVKRPKKFTGEHVRRGELGNIKCTIKEVYDLAKSNVWDWFITLTFDPEQVDSFDYSSVTEAMQKFTRIMRDKGFRYLIVPELHESGRYHFHGLVQGELPVSIAQNPYTGEIMFDNKGRVVYNIPIYKFGFTTATKIDDYKKAATYLTKYLSKELGQAVPKGKKRYWASKSLERPEIDHFEMSYSEFGTIALNARYLKQYETPYGKFSLVETD